MPRVAHRLEITLSEETWTALDDARGHEPRASFVKRALESALTGGEPDVQASSPTSASSRAPVEKESGEDRALAGEELRAALDEKAAMVPSSVSMKKASIPRRADTPSNPAIVST